LRVLHVNKFLYRRGGAEGYMLDVAELQRDAGDEVAFFGMRHPDNEPQRYEAWLPDLIELEPAPHGLHKAPAAARMIWSTSSRRGMSRVLRDFQPDIVHFHNIYHQLSPSILAGVARAGVPCVMTLHDYKLACPSYQLLDHGANNDGCVPEEALQAPDHGHRALAFDEGRATQDDDEAFALRGDEGVESCAGGGLA